MKRLYVLKGHPGTGSCPDMNYMLHPDQEACLPHPKRCHWSFKDEPSVGLQQILNGMSHRGTLVWRFFRKWSPANRSYISAWTCVKLRPSPQGRGVTRLGGKSSKKRGLGCVSGWHKVPGVPRRANAAAEWAKLAEGGCTSSAFGIPVAEIWKCPVQPSLTGAWIWGAEIDSRKACGNGERAGKFVLRGENLGSSLCLAENRRDLSWVCCDLYVTAGCTSWKLHRGKFKSETRTWS